jgi:WD40 repeat protein
MPLFLSLFLAALDVKLDKPENPVEPLAILEMKSSGVNCLAFSPDGSTIAVGCDIPRHGFFAELVRSALGISGRTEVGNCVVELWNAKTHQRINTLKGHSRPVLAVAVSSDGKTMASCDDDAAIQIWDIATGKVKSRFVSSLAEVKALTLSGDGKILAAGGPDGRVRLWDIATGKVKTILVGWSADTWISSIALSRDGKMVAAACSYDSCDEDSPKPIRVWNVKTGKVIAVLKGHEYSVTSVAFSPDGTLLASVSGDGVADHEWEEPPEPSYELKLWDAATGRELVSLSGDTGQMFAVAFSPDGKVLATGDWRDFAFPEDGPGRVRLWDVSALLKTKK